MTATTRRRPTGITLSPAEAEGLRDLLAELENHGAVLMTGQGRKVDVPPTALAALTCALEYLASGEPVHIIPADAELSTGEAAEILNFSRQYMVRLLDDGAIPSHRVGTHRRVRLLDVIRYREKRALEQGAAINKLIHLSEKGGDYDMSKADIDAFSRDAGIDDH